MSKKLVIFLAFLLITLIWFAREVFLGYLFCFSDLTYYFYPYRYFMVESIKNGIFPLWNPEILMGFPFFATLQPGVFYPLSILYYLLPFNQAFNWFLILHYPLAAFFMYLLCRDYKFSSVAAVGSSLAFAFSGYMLSVLHMPTSLSSVIWLPLVLLFFKRKHWVFTGIFLAIMFLGGEPTILYGTGLILLGYAIVSKFGNWKELGFDLLRILQAYLLAGLISAIQLLPFLELLRHCSRVGGLTLAEASGFSLPAKKMIEFIFPYFFHVTEFPWVEQGWIISPYLGLIPIILVIFALILSKSRKIRGLGLLLILISLILLGKNSPVPLYALLYKFLPGFSFIRYPIKFLFVITFIISFLAGFGIDLLWANIARIKKVLIWLFAILTIAFLLFLYFNLNQAQVVTFLKPLFHHEIQSGWEGYVKNITLPRNIANFGISLFFLFLFSLWLLTGYAKKCKKQLFMLGLVLLIFLDLFTANAGMNFSVKAQDYKVETKNVKILKSDQTTFRYYFTLPIAYRSWFGASQEFYNYPQALISLRNRLAPNQNMIYGLASVDGYESVIGIEQDRLRRRLYGLRDFYNYPVFDMLNVKYFITARPLKTNRLKLISLLKERVRDGHIFLYQNKNVLPRSYRVSKVKVIKDRSQGFNYLFSQQFDPSREIVLEEEVSSPGGFWFSSEWFYPGWKAYVDGKETKVYRANYMFRAIALPPGEHEIEFVYDPWSFKLGLIISSFTLLGLVIYLIWHRRKGLSE